MFAHHPVQRGEGGTGISSYLGGQQRGGALHPCHVGVAFGTRAGENGACGGGGFHQQAPFLLEGQLGALHLDDLMQPLGLGQRGRDAGGRSAGATLVATGGVKVVLDPGEAHRHVDLPVRAHRQPLRHQLRDAPLGQPDAGGEGGLGLGAVAFSHFRPLTQAS